VKTKKNEKTDDIRVVIE